MLQGLQLLLKLGLLHLLLLLNPRVSFTSPRIVGHFLCLELLLVLLSLLFSFQLLGCLSLFLSRMHGSLPVCQDFLLHC